MTTSQRRGSFISGFISAVVVCALAVGGFITLQVVSGNWRIWDEFQCSEGEAPAGTDNFFNTCQSLYADLPAGMAWDPLGNRPLECKGRSDWFEVRPTSAQNGSETDCYTAYALLPEGWELVTPRP